MEKHVIIFLQQNPINIMVNTVCTRALFERAPNLRHSGIVDLFEGKRSIERQRQKQIQIQFSHRVLFVLCWRWRSNRKKSQRKEEKKSRYAKNIPAYEEKSVRFSFSIVLCLVHINIINNIRAERYQFHINIHKS